MSKLARPRRWLRFAAASVLYLVLGLCFLVALIMVAVNLPPVSQFGARKVTGALAETFKGRIIVRRLGNIDFGGIVGAEAEVMDPEGRSVLAVRGVDVRVTWPRMIWDMVTGDAETTEIHIDRIALEHVRATLIDDGTGTPTLARAFEPAKPEPEPAEESTTVIVLSQIRLDKAEVRGSLQSPGPIDADLENLDCRIEIRPEAMHVLLRQLDVTARQLPVVDRVAGRLTAELSLPSEVEPTASSGKAPNAQADGITTETRALKPAGAAPRRILAAFAGEVAGSGLSADVRMVGEQLRATVEAPALSPSTLGKLAPSLSPSAPASLSTSVEGPLDDLSFQARVTQEGAEIGARGRVQRKEETSHIRAHVDVARVDLSRLMQGSTPTQINLGADANVALGPEGGSGSYEVVTAASRFGDERLPKARIEGQLSMPEEKPVFTRGTLDIDEPGAPTHIEYEVHSGDTGVRASFSAEARLSRPARLEQLSGGLLATGTLNAKGEFDGSAETLDASFDLRLREVQHPELTVRALSATGRAKGLAVSPSFDVSARLQGVKSMGRAFSNVRLSATGTPRRLALFSVAEGDNPDRIMLRATLGLSPELEVQDTEISVTEEGRNIRVTSERVAMEAGKIRVDDLKLDGAGRAEASLVYGKSLESLELRTSGLDPAALLEILGVHSPVKEARVDLQASYSARPQRGKLTLGLTDLHLGKLKNGRASADFTLERGKVSGEADLELARGAKTHLSVKDMRVPTGDAAATDLRRMNGDFALAGEVDLKELSALVSLPEVERAEGQVRFDVSMERPDAGGRPAWRARVETDSLILIQKRPDVGQSETPERARQTSPLWLRGVDFAVEAGLQGDGANVNGKVFDRRGDLLRVDAKWKQVAVVSDLSKLPDALLRAPWNARVEIPPRPFESFPAPVRPTEVAGTASLGVEAEGTIMDPRVRARGRVERFGPAGELTRAPKLDVELAAEYASDGGAVSVRAHDRKRALLDLATRWTGNAALLAKSAPGRSPIAGNLQVKLDEFPVNVVPELENRRVRGKLSGNIALEELGRDARFLLDLKSKDLEVDRLSVGNVALSVGSEGDQLRVRADLNGEGGNIEAELATTFSWGNRLLPEVDESVQGSVRARNFRLSALQPMVEGSVSELDGKLNADLRAAIEAGGPRLSGRMSLREGILHLPTVGQRFQGMAADVVVTPESIRVENMKARGTSGGFEANAQAKLDGLTPTEAQLEVRISEDNKLPLTIEGEAVGDGWGTIAAQYQHDEAAKVDTLRVSLEKFNIELPQAPSSDIQDLSQPEHIRVGFHRRDGDFVAIPLQPMKEAGAPSEYKTVVIVELGAVRIEKGQQAQVALGGEIKATVGEELDVRGKVETRRGQLDISGKTFDIERGTVTFTGGAPDDPTISAVARYDSPAGYTVYAEYTGTVTRGKLRLSSEPALSQDEILTLLMFGTPDGSFGAGSGDSLSTAVSVAGGTAAQGLNRALSDITDLDVSARVDTSTGAPRPELVLQVSSRVAARVSQALGEPSPGQSPDRTFLTIELRLASAWSLSTMIGDRGASALDLIWRRRY